MATKWQNADGLGVKFGSYVNDPKNYVNRFRALNEEGLVQRVVCDVDLTRIAAGTTWYPADLNNDGTNDGFAEDHFNFPAYSSILRAMYIARTAAAGGTSFTVGTYQKNGTAISANSIITATEGVLANIDTIGARTYGAGALVSSAVETASVGSSVAFPSIAVTGTFTAGTGLLIVEYVTPFANVTSA
jgi:hypothetical protein